MPFELGAVNIHLIELEDGYLMVDAGHGTPLCLEALEAGLAEHGVDWSEIRTLFLTHAHPDHVGLVHQILERTGARVLMHPLEAAHAEEIAALSRPGVFAEAMRIAGTPEDLQTRMLHQLTHNRADYRPVAQFQPVEGGERIATNGGLLEVIATPGHSVGHLCLYSSEERYLVSGDHLLKQITPNVSWRPNQDMLGRYIDSLDVVKPLDADVILPSHGKRFDGHQELAAMLGIHHEERCRQILSYIAEEPMTAHVLVGKMWPRGLAPVHHHFAVMEVLAHLEYLRRRGPVSAEAASGDSIEWRQS